MIIHDILESLKIIYIMVKVSIIIQMVIFSKELLKTDINKVLVLCTCLTTLKFKLPLKIIDLLVE